MFKHKIYFLFLDIKMKGYIFFNLCPLDEEESRG